MVWGRGKGTWVTKVAGPSISYYAPGPREGCQWCSLVIRTKVSGHIFWRGSSLGIKFKRQLGQWIHPGDVPVISPLLYYLIQIGQWPFCPLVLSLGQQ